MAQRLHQTYQTDGSVTASTVRDAVSGLSEGDITKKSPITAGGGEVGIEVGGTELHVRVEGHGGEWSKTSQTALERVVGAVDGVMELVGTDGGYEDDDEDGGESDGE